MDHTPTPWTIADSSNPKNGYSWRDLRAMGEFGEMYVGEALEADAAYIIHCVNTHDALVEALRAVQKKLEWEDDGMPVNGWMKDAVAQIKHALAEQGAA